MNRLKWTLQLWIFVAVTFPLSLLPYRVALAAGTFFGDLGYLFLRRRRKIALQNISACYHLLETGGKSAEEVARECFRNIGRSILEIFKLYYGRGDAILKTVQVVGEEHLQAARASGRGVLFHTAHCGNWEVTALWFGITYEPFAVMARRQDNPFLNEMVERMRMRYGNRIIYKSGGAREVFYALRRKGIVGVLADQAASPSEGFLIEFLGRPAWVNRMPVFIARRTGSIVLPAYARRNPEGGHIVEFFPPVTLSEGDSDQELLHDTEILSRILETFIRKHPADWYWVHRRWKRAPRSLPSTTSSTSGN